MNDLIHCGLCQWPMFAALVAVVAGIVAVPLFIQGATVKSDREAYGRLVLVLLVVLIGLFSAKLSMSCPQPLLCNTSADRP